MVPYGSTGNIMLHISEVALKQNYEVMAYTTDLFSINGKKKRIDLPYLSYYGSFFENAVYNYVGKLFGQNGFLGYFGTKDLIKQLKNFQHTVEEL